jgi:hypothetical protein
LEALAMYAVSVPSHDVNMQLLASTTENWSYEFSLKPETRLVLQQQTLPSVPTLLTFHAQGNGCSLIQVYMLISFQYIIYKYCITLITI